MSPSRKPKSIQQGTGVFYVLFFFSGFPALLYQVVWQRALFTIYGVNIESVTAIVTVFMLGLGLGSLAGGRLSKRPATALSLLFGVIELGIAIFGLVSLKLFYAAASLTAGMPATQTGIVTFLLLFVPTMLMGSTLPLLVAHLVRFNGNVGESVGSLYAVNTFGSAAACFLAAHVLMGALGESGCVRLAAVLNLCVAAAAIALHFFNRCASPVSDPRPAEPLVSRPPLLPFSTGLFVSGITGFVALGYEMVWYRLYSFASGRSAASFAVLLAWYLAGVGYGSISVRDLCRGRLRTDVASLKNLTAMTLIRANVAAFLLGPAVALVLRYVPLEFAYPFVFLGAALLGATFPLVSHACIDPAASDAGARLSYMYLANIIGCALGSYLVGMAGMDILSARGVSVVLLLIGLTAGWRLFSTSGRLAPSVRHYAEFGALAILTISYWPVYSTIYERLLFRSKYVPGTRFEHLVETRSGVAAVAADGTVYGGGVYDGKVSTGLSPDVNGIFRAYAADAIHPHPREILVIGLSMGSWAQVLANHPGVERVTIVEIDPGYLKIIPRYPAVESLLRNPKVEIVIDDGRRWLVRNPSRKFDFIVMNTSQHWLAHISNLLSEEFLRLIRPHLKPGGIHYYNTTFSPEALLTGATEFPFALRVGNFIAVSDSPILFDKERWRATLGRFTIDGKPVLDLKSGVDRERLEELVSLADTLHRGNPTDGMRLESGESMRARFRSYRRITDDNMGKEWQ
jgi:spermidine synthase